MRREVFASFLVDIWWTIAEKQLHWSKNKILKQAQQKSKLSISLLATYK